MLNPSYLIKSRHDIYYFRYPLPIEAQGKSNRVSISLKTRCPREALRLAKALEYHSVNLTEGMDLERMKHADIMLIFKSYYAEVLERGKSRIDEDGPLPKDNVLSYVVLLLIQQLIQVRGRFGLLQTEDYRWFYMNKKILRKASKYFS